MLKDIIYFSSYVFVLLLLVSLNISSKRRTSEVFFILGVCLVPIGKLFYMPLPGFVSIKAAFVYAAVVGGVTFLLSWLRGIDRFALVPFVFLVPILLSIMFMAPQFYGAFLSSPDGSGNGTIMLRLVSIAITSMYAAAVLIHVSTNPNAVRDVAVYYVGASLFATAVGAIMFYGIFVGQLTIVDITPVTVDEPHISGRFFRFNPGANVNEFGQVVGYALLMLRWTGWKPWIKFFAAIALLGAEFLSLTRGAWLATVVAYVVFALLSRPTERARFIVGGTVIAAIFLAVVLNIDFLNDIIATRTSISAGAGGEDRLRSAAALYDALTSSPMRLVFGYGWTADVFAASYGFGFAYIHNVPLMMLFDTGLLGVSIYLVTLITLGRFVFGNIAEEDRNIVAALITFMFTVSLLEHNFFHVQTWLIIGLILGMAFRAHQAKIAAASLVGTTDREAHSEQHG